VSLWTSAALAQTSTYQNRIMGQRSLGMGGAFTGIGNDPSSAYYNPAALSNLSTLQLEVGLPVVAFDQQRLKSGLVRNGGSDANSLTALALPTMIGVATGIGPKDATDRERFTLAVSLLIPWQKQMFFREAVQNDTMSAVHLFQESEQTALIGASLSARLGIVSLGASLYYMHQNLSWLTARTGTLSSCSESGCAASDAYNSSQQLEGWFGAINPRVGFLVKPTPRFSLGLMVSLSSFRLFGTGSVKTSSYTANAAGIANQQFYATDRLAFDRPLPWELRLGVGINEGERFTFAADVSFYLPQTFRMFSNVDDLQLTSPAVVDRAFIVNGNIGFEYLVTPTVPIRFGAFTNLSATPAVQKNCDALPCLTRLHSAGVTGSVGAQIWKVQLHFGVIASYGAGEMQQLDPTGPTKFRWSELDQIQVQLFIGGNLAKVLGDTALTIADRIRSEAERRAASQPPSAPASNPADDKAKTNEK
jgi:hypothetical protein